MISKLIDKLQVLWARRSSETYCNYLRNKGVKIGSNTSISQLEDYATSKLAMHYPEGNECIHLATVELPEENLADIIKQKAYA